MKKLLLAFATIVLSLPAYAQSTLYSNSTTGMVGIGTTSPTTPLQVNGTITDLQSIGAVSTDGVTLTDTTAATSGNQQWSPRVRWTGQGWKTNATAGSQEVDAIAEVQPVQGTANPTFNWVLSGQVNGGGYGPLLTVPSGGNLNLNSGVYEINGTQLAASNLLNGVNGSGSIVLTISPSLTTPNIGAAIATTPATGDNSTKVATTAFVASATRIRLTANQTFYLSTTGSDSNNCLSSGTACATLNYVWDLIATNYDLNGYTATIQLADGTYTNGLEATIPALGGPVVINGDSTTPSNVIVSPSSTAAIFAYGSGVTFTIQNLEMTSSGDSDLAAEEQGSITAGPGLVFGATVSPGGAQIGVQTGGAIYITSSYSIVGGAGFHFYAADGGLIRVTSASLTATLSGTPAFSDQFAAATEGGQIVIYDLSYSGSATGQRYAADLNGIINTDTGSASYLPGNSAGTTSLGGQYN